MAARTSDGLECFNFQLLLDDIPSSADRRRRDMFLTPQLENTRRPRLGDSGLNRNLGEEFLQADQEKGDRFAFNLEMFSDRDEKNGKHLTPDTNYTQGSTEKRLKLKGKGDYSIWGGLHIPRKSIPSDDGEGDEGESPLADRSNERDLMKDLTSSLGPDFGQYSQKQQVAKQAKQQGNLFEACFGPNGPIQSQNGFRFGETLSVDSASGNGIGNFDESLSHNLLPQQEKQKNPILDALSESFEPSSFQRRLKKNSMSACKAQGFSGRYRKLSYQERDHRLPRRHLYEEYKRKTGEPRILCLSEVLKETPLDKVLSLISTTVEELIQKRNNEDFPDISSGEETR